MFLGLILVGAEKMSSSSSEDSLSESTEESEFELVSFFPFLGILAEEVVGIELANSVSRLTGTSSSASSSSFSISSEDLEDSSSSRKVSRNSS